MKEVSNINNLPSVPAVYLMYEGKDVIYAGVSKSLKARILQHLIRRDSSITTGASAVSINPDYLDKIVWYQYDSFEDKITREAAEIIAFDVFKPVIKSRGKVNNASKELSLNEDFKKEITNLFDKGISGYLKIENFETVLYKVSKLEEKINLLQDKIENLPSK